MLLSLKSIRNVRVTHLIQNVRYESSLLHSTRSSSTGKPPRSRDELEKRFNIRKITDWYNTPARVLNFILCTSHHCSVSKLLSGMKRMEEVPFWTSFHPYTKTTNGYHGNLHMSHLIIGKMLKIKNNLWIGREKSYK